VTTLSDQLGRKLSAFDRKLDWLIVASTNEEDVAALPRVMERYPPDAVLWSGNRQASFSAGALNEYLISQEIPITNAEKDQVLDLGDGATLTVLTTGPSGAVLLIEYQNFRVLLPVGMSFEALDELQYGESVEPEPPACRFRLCRFKPRRVDRQFESRVGCAECERLR
jgi:hypothetical protein